MTAVLALAGWEVRAAVRSRWVLAMSAVLAAASVALTVFGLSTLRELGLAGANAVADGLLNLGVLLPPLVGLLLGAGVIAGARERRTLALLGAQPLAPSALVLGWFAGLTAAVWLVVAAAFGAAAVAAGAVIDAADVAGFVAVTLITMALATVSVSIGLAISSRSESRMQALAVAVALWFLLAIGMDLVLVVVVPGMQLGPTALLLAVLLNPLESSRILAVLLIDPDAISLGTFGHHVVGRLGVTGARVVLAGSLVTWTIGSLFIAGTSLRRRDL